MTSTTTGPGDQEQGHGGGAWFDRWAQQYDGERRLLISPFDAYYGAAAEAAALMPGSAEPRRRGADGGPVRLLDLGAGTGLLTAALAQALPGATLTLLDEAPGMLAQARERLAPHEGTVEVLVGDLLADMPAGPFDVISSGLAIHHLSPTQQAATYATAAERLAPGGVFINLEQLRAPAAAQWLEDHYIERELVHARAGGFTPEQETQAWERWSIDQHVDLQQHLDWLSESGLSPVDCVFKSWRFAVLAGWRS